MAERKAQGCAIKGNEVQSKAERLCGRGWMAYLVSSVELEAAGDLTT